MKITINAALSVPRIEASATVRVTLTRAEDVS